MRPRKTRPPMQIPRPIAVALYIACIVVITMLSAVAAGAPPTPPPSSASPREQRLWQRAVVDDAAARDAVIDGLLNRLAAIDAAKLSPPDLHVDDVAWVRRGDLDPGNTGRFTHPALLEAKVRSLPATAKVAMLDLEGHWQGTPAELLAADPEFAAVIDSIHALRPDLPVLIYAFPVVTCTANDEMFKIAARGMRQTLARVAGLTPAVYDDSLDNTPQQAADDQACARAAVQFALELAPPGRPVLPIVYHRVEPGLDLEPLDQLAAHVAAAMSARYQGRAPAGAVAWMEADAYFEDLRRRPASATDAAFNRYRLESLRVFPKEIPAGVAPAEWLAWVKASRVCALRAAVLGDRCIAPPAPASPTGPVVSVPPPVVSPSPTRIVYSGPHTFSPAIEANVAGLVYPNTTVVAAADAGIPRGARVSVDGVRLQDLTLDGMGDAVVVEPCHGLVMDRVRALRCRTPDAAADSDLLGRRGYGFYGFGVEDFAIRDCEFRLLIDGPQHSNQYAMRCGLARGSIERCAFAAGNGKRVFWGMYLDHVQILDCTFDSVRGDNAGVVFGVSPGEVAGVLHGQCVEVTIRGGAFDFKGGSASSIVFQAGTNGVLLDGCKVNSQGGRWLGIDNRGDVQTVAGVAVDYHVQRVHWRNIVWNGRPVVGYDGVGGADRQWMGDHDCGPVD